MIIPKEVDAIRLTKIVCTIGPGTQTFSQIKKLHDAGMNIARINCSHGDHEQYKHFIDNIKKTSKGIAIMLDTQGPEIRTGMVEPNTILHNGKTFTITPKRLIGNEKIVTCTYKNLADDVKKDDKIFIDSGFLQLKVIKKKGRDVITKVICGGPLGDQKGINHPATISKIPSVTKKDADDIKFGLKNDIDFIAASFIREAKDVRKIRSLIKNYPHVKIIAKIENSVALKNIDSILKEADAIMVARGDLGVEIPEEKLAVVQKRIIRKCNLAGKPVITATQMLESMVHNPLPTRAEATDVANAIFDGTDAIMLSEETAIGAYPDTTVRMMVKIALATEPELELHRKFAPNTVADSIALAINNIIEYTPTIKKVVVCTRSGYSARAIAKYRPHAEIIAATTHPRVVRRMQIYWGVFPVLIEKDIKKTRDLIHSSLKHAHKTGLVNKKETIVITAGHPFHARGKTNLIEIHTVGELLSYGPGYR